MPNRKTLEAITILSDKGCCPLDILSDIAMGNLITCGLTIEGITEEIQMRPSLDQRKDAAKELLQYIYPKRKAIEHSGSIALHEETLEALAAEEVD